MLMSPWIERVICLMVGGTIGMVVMACCAAAGNADRQMERRHCSRIEPLEPWPPPPPQKTNPS